MFLVRYPTYGARPFLPSNPALTGWAKRGRASGALLREPRDKRENLRFFERRRRGIF